MRGCSQGRGFADIWGYASVETDWRSWSRATTSTRSTSACPTTCTRRSRSRPPPAGKMILCEKPLAMDVAEGEAMVAAVEQAGVPNMVWYNYRRVPAVSLAKQLVEEGTHRPALPLPRAVPAGLDHRRGRAAGRRRAVAARRQAAGSGVTGDLLAHNIDTAMWLNGPITRVVADDRDLREGAPAPGDRQVEPVGIDDACMFICRFANGCMGVFEIAPATPAATRRTRPSSSTAPTAPSIRPARAESTSSSIAPGDRRGSCRATRGWRRIHVTNGEHPYMSHWWVPGLRDRLRAQLRPRRGGFPRGLETGVPAQPDFAFALQTQKVCEAVLRSARVGTVGRDGSGLHET